jgi:c-di-GMP-binding flagellar brake protein YcgR
MMDFDRYGHRNETERRRWPRVRFDKRVTAYTEDQERLLCQALNLSAGGVALDASRIAFEASQLRVNLPLDGGHTVVVDGAIVDERHTSGGRIWHLRFDRVPTRIRDQLTTFVENQSTRALE